MPKKRKNKEPMLAAFDIESEGLNGRITRIGFTLDGKTVTRTTPEEFLPILNAVAQRENKTIYLYAHNMDFDFSKLYKEGGNLHLSDKELLPINGALVRAAFLEYPDIIFCDSYKLVPSKLEKITKDYELEASKLEVDYKKFGFNDKDEYFKHAEEVDPEHFEQYWENDVKAEYQLIETIMKLNDLTLAEIIKCPTAPSLSMRIYRRECPDEIKLIEEQKTPWWLEDFFRMGYVGGRTEVFKPRLEADEHGLGYHYDVNSLYPYVMANHEYPVGTPYPFFDGTRTRQIYEEIKAGQGEYKVGIIHCKVYAPETLNIPVLPFRTPEKLLFPVGTFYGQWCTPELEEAERMGYRILEVYDGVFWKQTAPLFAKIIDKWSKIKMTATGAKRESAKLLQNSLYGKFGMNRPRKCYKRYTEAEYKKLQDKGIPCAKIEIAGEKWIEYHQNSHAAYIHPEISAFVTCYARLWLFRGMRIAEALGADLHYCDTDSLVINKTLPDNEVDPVLYGRFKLEHKITDAVFLQPKLYAEIADDGKLIAKSKGLVQQKREELTFDDYLNFYNAMITKNKVELYRDIEGRRRLLSSLKRGDDTDKPYLQNKAIDFSRPQKRDVIFDSNTTRPIVLRDGKWFIKEMNGFMKAAMSMAGDMYCRKKCAEKRRRGEVPTYEERRQWTEFGRLHYREICGIITNEDIKKERGAKCRLNAGSRKKQLTTT